MSTIHTLLAGNDSILEVDGLKNDLTGEFLNGAEVTVTLLDANGLEVNGDVWPKTMAYVALSNGTYRATMLYSLALVLNGRYTAQITVNGGPGLRARWDMECVCRSRN